MAVEDRALPKHVLDGLAALEPGAITSDEGTVGEEPAHIGQVAGVDPFRVLGDFHGLIMGSRNWTVKSSRRPPPPVRRRPCRDTFSFTAVTSL
ncbi:hypothetical protein [Streptomyces olivaceoviridis]|uniref:hypothetical protein n=1 Tax=Streptomyces olivaceoviridis TaxID=1921 RepID=UPI0036F8316A